MSDLGFDALLRGCENVYTREELQARLQAADKAGRQLRVKLGMDPTAPDIHLGHAVQLRKMRQFQDLGHKAVLIIGDFTAQVGDPTGRSKTRPVLTREKIESNAQTYLDQAGRILDLAPDKIELRHNSEWLSKMGFADVLRLAGQMTLGQVLKREDFRNRFETETPIGLHEFMYPLMQGWDSVNIQADVELGGTDQTYNNLVGRDLQASAGQPPQIVMILPLLRGLDGQAKMSKSYGNYIGIAESPRDMFGKTMRIPDDLLGEWYRLLTDVPLEQTEAAIRTDPMAAKAELACTVGARFHSADEMAAARAWWHERFSERKSGAAAEVRVPAGEIDGGQIAVWKLAWLAHDCEISKSEARRMVQGGAFEFDGRKITDPNELVPATAGTAFRAGRYRKGERVKQPLLAVVVLE